jgi:hypothetical protein
MERFSGSSSRLLQPGGLWSPVASLQAQLRATLHKLARLSDRTVSTAQVYRLSHDRADCAYECVDRAGDDGIITHMPFVSGYSHRHGEALEDLEMAAAAPCRSR